tara:strand:+ start:2291 stop:4210 length:1920 start_codon:yes stop_codon:yes gene_type:complete
MELLRDPKIEEKFHNLVRNFLTKNENYDVSKFIGGLPVTLERNDIFDLLLKNSRGNYKYTVTQKVDGTRMLMYIGLDMGNKDRVVCFIDRNMKIYTIRDSSRSILPYVNSREMLIDGELVFFDSEGNSYKDLESSRVKGVSFMAFDMLFGPENIDISPDGTKLIGQEFSMMVPEDGILRSYEWRYISRYDILHKLIVPSKFNKEEPILTKAFKDTNWFNIELKPIYFLDSIKDRVVLYNSTKSGYLQTLISKQRREFYGMLMIKYNKNTNIFTKKALELDGLIFTSEDTLYTIGSWNKLLSIQFKWKPVEQQTVDLLIKKSRPRDSVAQLFIAKKGKIEPFQFNYKTILASVPENISDNSIGEFSIDSSGNFVFKEIRQDKKTPNALKTVLNVINSFKNPVNINEFHYFLHLPSLGKKDLEKILKYSSKTKLLQCVTYYNGISSLKQEDANIILEMIKTSFESKDLELELRLGKLDKFFNPRLFKDRFNSLLLKAEQFKFKKNVDQFVDVYSDKVRTRYLFSEEFKRYVFFESIVKNRIKNLDLKTDSFLGNDIRVALSSETNVKEYNEIGEAYSKNRISFTEPNNLFRIDFTIIKEGSFESRTFQTKDKANITYQVEVEILSEKVVPENLFKFLAGFL